MEDMSDLFRKRNFPTISEGSVSKLSYIRERIRGSEVTLPIQVSRNTSRRNIDRSFQRRKCFSEGDFTSVRSGADADGNMKKSYRCKYEEGAGFLSYYLDAETHALFEPVLPVSISSYEDFVLKKGKHKRTLSDVNNLIGYWREHNYVIGYKPESILNELKKDHHFAVNIMAHELYAHKGMISASLIRHHYPESAIFILVDQYVFKEQGEYLVQRCYEIEAILLPYSAMLAAEPSIERIKSVLGKPMLVRLLWINNIRPLCLLPGIKVISIPAGYCMRKKMPDKMLFSRNYVCILRDFDLIKNLSELLGHKHNDTFFCVQSKKKVVKFLSLCRGPRYLSSAFYSFSCVNLSKKVILRNFLDVISSSRIKRSFCTSAKLVLTNQLLRFERCSIFVMRTIDLTNMECFKDAKYDINFCLKKKLKYEYHKMLVKASEHSGSRDYLRQMYNQARYYPDLWVYHMCINSISSFPRVKIPEYLTRFFEKMIPEDIKGMTIPISNPKEFFELIVRVSEIGF